MAPQHEVKTRKKKKKEKKKKKVHMRKMYQTIQVQGSTR